MASNVVKVSITIENFNAIRAMVFATRTLVDLQEDMPYRPEIAKAIKALRYARKNLKSRHCP